MNPLVPLPPGGQAVPDSRRSSRWVGGAVALAAVGLATAWALYPGGQTAPADPRPPDPSSNTGEVRDLPVLPAPRPVPAPAPAEHPQMTPPPRLSAGSETIERPSRPVSRDVPPLPHPASPQAPLSTAPSEIRTPQGPAAQGLPPPPPRPQAQVYSSRPETVRAGGQAWGVCSACGVVASVQQVVVPQGPGLEVAAGAAWGAAAGAQLGGQTHGGALGAAVGAAVGAQVGAQAAAAQAAASAPAGPLFEHHVRLESGADVVVRLPYPVPVGTAVMMEQGQLKPLRERLPTPAQGGQVYSARP